jgi:type IV secretion system protein VirD4
MSRAVQNHPPHEDWGPVHQHMSAPWQRERQYPLSRLIGWFFAAMLLHGVIDKGGRNEFFWCLNAMIVGWLVKKIVAGIRDGHIPVDWLLSVAHTSAAWMAVQFARRAPIALLERIPALNTEPHAYRDPAGLPALSPAQRARWEAQSLGGGAYLGETERGEWVCADPQSAVMVLGPPRSGKTSAVMIPALLCAPGAAVSTSTKPDVMRATRRARAELGQVWLFDPAGREHRELPQGVRELRWSPVAAADSWDRALIVARAMTASTHPGRGTSNESHWSERASALLAPLLYAASVTGRAIEDVLRWTLRQDMTSALEILGETHKHEVAADVLIGIQRTDTRERSSIYSATAGVLAAYNADATRATAKDPNFDPQAFAGSTDTIYITAPEQKQALCAPLIVGLLEQIRHAVYEHAREQTAHAGGPQMLWALDEVANIAPIHDLPSLVSQAGGQGLQVMIGLQDLSQARARWGQDAAEGFMSLFQTRLVLSGIADPKTLESISLELGEYDRTVFSATTGTSESEQWFSLDNRSEGVSRQTHRQRTLTPGEIASLPAGRALLLQAGAWELIRLTPWHRHSKWANVAHNSIYG